MHHAVNLKGDLITERLHTRQYYRAIFLSDFHMGAKSFDAPALLDFLQKHDCDYLYLTGDIIDGWKLCKRWHWSDDCDRVIDALLTKAKSGTRLYYLPGNHDDELRRVLPFLRGRFSRKTGIRIRDKAIHITATGRKFLVMHGDQFDRGLLRGRLSRWSDAFYDRFLDLIGGHGPSRITKKGRTKPFSLAKALRKQGQKALQLLNNFENALYHKARQGRYSGIICGHTHIPVVKLIRNITYANCGSWTGSGHTALVETHDGELQLIDWPSSATQPTLFAMPAKPDAPPSKEALKISRQIRLIWPVRGKARKQETRAGKISAHPLETSGI